MGENINGQDMAAQLGIINVLRTGDPILDVMVCMIIPVILKFAFEAIGNARPMIIELINKLRQSYVGYERVISYEERVNMYGDTVEGSGDQRNNILQKAMLHYIATLKIDYRLARTNLMAIKEKGSYDTNQYEMVYGSTAEQLQGYDVIAAPPLSLWVDVAPGVELMIEEDSDDSSGGEKNNSGGSDGDKSKKVNITSVTYRVRSNDLLHGATKVDEFIKVAYKYYIDEMAKFNDTSRYLYMLDSASEEGNKDGGRDAGVRHYKRYRLSGEKKFSSLFFKGKEPLLQQLNHFLDKTGKYQVDGFPHKLGVLLYGPPGTGKTSLIKAIAESTGRNVVSIPLARIKTNQELMDIVYDQRFKVKDEDMPIKLNFKDVIYVFEDIDCASKIVHRRKKKEAPVKETIEITKRVTVDDEPDGGAVDVGVSGGVLAPIPLMRNVSTASTSGTRSSTTTVTRQVSGGTSKAATGKTGSSSLAEVDVGDYEDDEDEDEDDDKDMKLAKLMSQISLATGTADTKTPAVGASTKLKMTSKTDRLDLAGVLNVLDGVVDCPGRLLIMTTNHPEKLDPALIRPGRIDRKLRLGYMDAGNVVKMVEHCFLPFMDDKKLGRDGCGNVLKPEERSLIEKLFSDSTVQRTPAQIEQLCAEHDDVESFVDALVNGSGKAEEF